MQKRDECLDLAGHSPPPASEATIVGQPHTPGTRRKSDRKLRRTPIGRRVGRRMRGSLIIGVVRESAPGETRVAATPSTVEQLVKLGYDVVVEMGAGAKASFADEQYVAAGAAIGDALGADIVLGVNAPTASELNLLRGGATLIAILQPMFKPELVEDLARRPITVLSMDAVPRISR